MLMLVSVSRAVFSSEKDNWETPGAFFKKLDDEFNFVLDAAAQPGKNKCACFISPKEDALISDWVKFLPKGTNPKPANVFLNPPYGRGRVVEHWMRRAHEMAQRDEIGKVVCLVAARTDTIWFHDLAWKYAEELRFVKGRLVFEEGGVPAKNGGTFPSLVVIFGGRKRPGSPKVSVMERK